VDERSSRRVSLDDAEVARQEGIKPSAFGCSPLRISSRSLFGRTKILGSDPPLPTVRTAYPTPPLQTWPVLFDPPIKLPGSGPRGYVHLDRRINCPAVCFAVLARIEIHRSLEHAADFLWKSHARATFEPREVGH
jgi:hypothetical protein